MTLARLDASLLARKGAASPIANAYADPFLDPIGLRPRPQRKPMLAARTARCRLRPDLHGQLRILAARQGRRLAAVLEQAVTDYLAANGKGCPCIGSGSMPAPADCCGLKR